MLTQLIIVDLDEQKMSQLIIWGLIRQFLANL